MSGTNGMQGGQMPQLNQMPVMPQPGQMPQAVPLGQQGGQMPVQMGQSPYQYGLPQTTQYVENQARARMPNQPY